MIIDDIARFADLHVSSGDIDPAYPVLRILLSDQPTEEKLMKVLSYVAFYDLSSAVTWWGDMAEAEDLPCATERRGLRGGVIVRHLESLKQLRERHGSWESWLKQGWKSTDNPRARWNLTFSNLQQAWQNGRWAAYKTCEILATVLGWPITAPDAGHAWSSGPRKGLAFVYGPQLGNSPWVVELLDRQTEQLRLEIAVHDGPFLPVEQLETVLCDFYSMTQSRYYIGHDIDQQLEQLMRPSTPSWVAAQLLQARQAYFRPAWLGEYNDWSGVDRERCSAYARTGLILTREF